MKNHATLDVYAHCDIPCGIYTPTTAQLAAQTVEKMVLKLQELKMPDDLKNQQAVLGYLNSVSRMVAVKERPTQILFNTILSILSGIGIIFVFSPLLLYWWIHGDYNRYLWIISGPFPYSHLGGGPFQLVLYVGLFGIGILLVAVAFILRKRHGKK